MDRIPGKFLNRTADTKEALQAVLSDREFGFCYEDNTGYTKREGVLVPLWHLPELPNGPSFLVGSKDGEDPGVYGWEPAEIKQQGTEQTSDLKLWSRIGGKGFFAEVAKNDERGRNIAHMLDLAGIGLAIYGETSYDEIVAMHDTYSYIFVLVEMDSGNSLVYLPMSYFDDSSITFSDVLNGTDYCSVSISSVGWSPVNISVIRPLMTDEEFEEILHLLS